MRSSGAMPRLSGRSRVLAHPARAPKKERSGGRDRGLWRSALLCDRGFLLTDTGREAFDDEIYGNLETVCAAFTSWVLGELTVFAVRGASWALASNLPIGTDLCIGSWKLSCQVELPSSVRRANGGDARAG